MSRPEGTLILRPCQLCGITSPRQANGKYLCEEHWALYQDAQYPQCCSETRLAIARRIAAEVIALEGMETDCGLAL